VDTPKEGLPIVPAEPVSGREPLILCGVWVDRVEKRGEFVVLHRESGGQGVMLDKRAVEWACIGLGIEIRR
jgi:hypothetical protein